MNKKSLSESDICDKFIRPAMEQAGWDGMAQIYREFPLRAGRVVVHGRRARRDATTVLRADYALFFKPNIPLAVVEAKDNHHAMGAGMAQAIHYAELLDVPFSFASNGDGFVFRDATLADAVLERNLTLEEFPSPAELWARYCAWKGWTPEVRQVTEHDYAPAKTPRYYQLNAINRTVEAIARGQNRACWSWPPAPARPTPPSRSSGGCGRAAPGKRILFLADRNILIDQTNGQRLQARSKARR
jgi:type I restriction enzyme R subunit